MAFDLVDEAVEAGDLAAGFFKCRDGSLVVFVHLLEALGGFAALGRVEQLVFAFDGVQQGVVLGGRLAVEIAVLLARQRGLQGGDAGGGDALAEVVLAQEQGLQQLLVQVLVEDLGELVLRFAAGEAFASRGGDLQLRLFPPQPLFEHAEGVRPDRHRRGDRRRFVAAHRL